ITLIDPSRSLDDLMPIALTNRPELAAQQSLIQAALVRVRQEKMRPLLPLIMITGFQTPGGMTTQAGVFATGNGDKLNLCSFRWHQHASSLAVGEHGPGQRGPHQASPCGTVAGDRRVVRITGHGCLGSDAGAGEPSVGSRSCRPGRTLVTRQP